MTHRGMLRVTSVVAATVAVVLSATPATSAVAKQDDDFIGITELVVRIDPTVTSIAAVNAVGHTVTVRASSGLPDTYLIGFAPGTDPATAEAAIDAEPGVEWVIPNAGVNPPEVDLARVYAWRVYRWALGTAIPDAGAYASSAVDLDAAHHRSTGVGSVVAVLDTGVQMEPVHPALTGSLLAGIDLVDNDTVPAETRNGIDDDGDDRIDEGIGHGTHVAGIVHQAAPGAKILPVRVLDDDGTGTMWNVAEGMFWAAANGADVINVSLGAHGSAALLSDATQVVSAAGVVVVAAAGNDGKDRTTYPAAAPDAIAVASVGAGDVVSDFSNVGDWVDVAAPGENIHSAYAFPSDSWAMNSGTSMATPWVAGEAALLRSIDPNLSPRRVRQIIVASAKNIDAVNPLLAGSVGGGRVDFGAAVNRL